MIMSLNISSYPRYDDMICLKYISSYPRYVTNYNTIWLPLITTTTAIIVEYKQVAGISFGVLILVLVANFGLTIATIFLTRQFSVTEGGVLVDKSTGNQVTTKAVGNLVGVTMGIDENVAARELQEAGDQCYAYTNMEHSVFEEYQGGTPTNYNVVVNGVSSSGEVIQGTAQFVEQYEDEDYQDVVCNVYRNIRATVGGPENERVVDMVCCGSIADAYFGSENCCISLPDTDTSGRLLGVK